MEPNDAKAPDPRPKADDAPVVGEAMLVVVSGDMPLAFPPAAPSPPNLFAAGYARTESGFVLSLLLLLGLDVDKESLLLLQTTVSCDTLA